MAPSLTTIGRHVEYASETKLVVKRQLVLLKGDNFVNFNELYLVLESCVGVSYVGTVPRSKVKSHKLAPLCQGRAQIELQIETIRFFDIVARSF